MKKEAILVAAVFLLAFWLRIVGILTVPSGLNADEAAIGYNAYSLLETGKDEYGAAFPLVFKSFGDYKPGIYFYLTMPFVKVFGLTELAVRLPSIILGSFTTLIVYFLAKELLMRPAIVFMALLAISPWHLHFSRGGWETNLATFFITAGAYLFLRARRTKSFKIMALAVLSAVIS
ncbi:MAG: glycosyltransferase family 39 protein, partial [bacterium]|nr:glycosyltransferase family 39 protein [bacterium]